MFELTAWLRKSLAGAYHGFHFDSWLRRQFKSARRNAAGTIFSRPKARSYRAEVVELESRVVPTGLQLAPINIFQPSNAALAFAPSTPGAGNTGTPISVEGQTVVAGEHLLEFEDTVGAADLTHLTATISWSDGTTTTGITSSSTSVATIVFLPAGGTTPGTNFAVVTLAAGAHVYDESLTAGGGNLNYFVEVSDDGVLSAPAGTIQDGTPLNPPDGVVDAPLTDTTVASALPNPAGFEGVAVGTVPSPVIVATFSDANPSATVADYTVAPGNFSVTWTADALQADAPAPTYTIVETGTTATASTWAVEASGLVFAEPGAYQPAVTVNDDGGATVSMPATETPTFTISDAGLNDTSTGATVSGPSPGVAANGVVLGTFTDNNPFAPATDYNLTVNWPEGAVINTPTDTPTYTVSSLGKTGLGGVSSWEVVANNIIFTEDGTNTPTLVQIADVDGSSLTLADPNNVTVAVAPVVINPAPTLPPINEGDTVSNVQAATFTDPAGAATVGGLVFQTTASNGTSNRGVGNAIATVITVASPVNLSNIGVEIDLNGNGNLNYFIFDSNSGTLLYQSGPEPFVDDGMAFHVSNPLSFTLNPGTTYAIGATSDVGGIYAFTFPGGAAQNGITSEGGNQNAHGFLNPALNLIHFATDGETQLFASPYAATIDWGDGTPPSVGTITPIGGNDFSVTGSHTYAEESVPGAYTISTTVVHESATTGPTATTSETVNEVQITNLTGAGATQTINEGDSTAPITALATFTDPAGAEAPSAYTATINWGDGSPTSVGTVVNIGGNNFEVNAPAHQYAEETVPGPADTVTVTVQHETAAPLTVNAAAITVNDPAVLATGVASINASEGAAFSGVTVATFTDPGGAEADDGTHYSASIDWGDGGAPSAGTITLISGSLGSPTAVFAVTGSYTYAEEGAYTVTVTIDHEAATPAIVTDSAIVAEVPVVVTGGLSITPVEGQVFSGTVATFTDPGTPAGEPLSEYAATINWGDGQSSPGVISGPVDGVFTVTGTHTYAEESGPDVPNSQPYQISVSVQHGDLVVNGSFESPTVAAGSFGIFESIPGWTDSSGNGIELDGAGTIGVPFDGDQSLELNSVGPADISQTVPTAAGETYVLSFAFSAREGTSPVDNDMQLIVDGSPITTLTADGSAQETGYDWQVYTYTITAASNSTTIEFKSLSPAGDSVGGELDAVSLLPAGIDTATVSDPPVVLNSTSITLPAINEGGSTGTVTVATFTDPGGAEATSDYAATIDWGDGQTTTNATIVYDPDNNVFDVQGSHTYLEESTNNDGGPGNIGGIYQITTTVVHELSTPTPSAVTATELVNEVPVVIQPGGTLQLFGTGVDSKDALLPAGSVDPHYTLVSNANGSGPNAFVADPADSPNGTGGWFGNSSTAQWIAPQTDDDNGDAVGNFDYQTSFTLSAAVSPSTVVITGDFAADNSVEIFVNGVDTGVGVSGNLDSGYDGFTLNSGDATFQAGTNTIDFVVFNAGGPSGLIVDNIVGTAQSGAVLNEGQATGNVIVATFTDPAGAESPSDYAATIDWGDGTPPTAATNIVAIGGNTFAVYGSHTYPEESTNPPEHGANADGTFHVNVTVNHEGDITTLDDTTNFTVNDPALTNVQGNPNTLIPVEGNNGAYLLATFVDPGNPNGTTGDDYPGNPDGNPVEYSAEVNWGDGTPIDSNVTFAYDSVNNVFDVDGTHAYREESAADNPGSTPYTITVYLQHEETTPPAPVTDTAIVSDPAVIATPGQTAASGVENQSTNTIILAAFTDPGDDGNVVSGVTVTDGGDYYYASPTVFFSGGGGSGATGQAILGADPDTEYYYIASVVITNPGIGYTSAPTVTFVGDTFGDPAVGVATLTPDVEPISDYSAAVNWGDGTTENTATSPNIFIVSAGVNQYLVLGSHTYTDESGATPYLIQTTVDHEAAPPSNTVTIPATIADPSVDATGNFNVTAVEGSASTPQTVATFTDPGGAESTGNPGAEYSATINWGDGTLTSAGTITFAGGTFTVQGSHTYAEEGSYTISILLTHGSAPNVTVTSTATVSDPAVVVNTTPLTFTAVEGASTTQPVATFTDPGGPEGLNEYSALINWGDGTPQSAGVITYSASTQTFTVWGTHTYAEESATPYSIVTTVSHGTAPPATALTPTGNLVTNGGFETGDFTGWTQSGNTGSTFVGGGANSGDFAANFGPVGSLGFLTQNIPTVPGDVYTFSFFLQNNGGTPNEFEASWNGTVVYGPFTNLPSFAYTQLSFTVTATTTSTPIQFGFQNDPNYFHLDDVSVSGTGTSSAFATVTNPAVNATGATLSAVEGADVAPQVVATFSDPGGAEPVGNYSADIDWTGAGSNYQIGAGVISYNATTNTFTVTSQAGENTFTDEGVYSILVRINHEDATPAVVTSTVNVSDPSVIATGGQTFIAVEGQTPANAQTLATFTDPGGAEAIGEYAATINWGDHSATSSGTISVDNGVFSVAGNHQYAEEGTYTVTVAITHGSSAKVFVTSTAVVSDPSVVLNTPPLSFSAVVGAVSAVQPVATFTDPGGAEGLSDYVATVSWGDSTGPTTGTITYADGTFTVWGAHDYAGDGSYPITVTVNHGASTPSVLQTATATVNDPSVILNASPLSFSAVEGSLSAVQTVATFTDPGGPQVHQVGNIFVPNAGAYVADIDWGDGTTATLNATITYNFVTQTFSVLGQHDYVEEGSYPIFVTVFHGTSTGVSTQTATATVSDPAVVGVGGFAINAVEGTLSAAQTLATFTDPGDPTGTVESGSDYSASINWGDGTAIGTRTEANGGITFNAATKTFTVLGAHDYAEEGTYQITIVINHDAAPPASVTSTATVSDPSVILNTASPLSITSVEGQQITAAVATFTDPGGAEAVGEYSASIAWGDGNTTPGLITQTGANSYSVSLFHAYAQEGTYNITVTVTHGTSTPASGVTASATVSDPSVVLNGTPIAFNATEGAAFSNQAVATFTDPGGAEAVGQYSAIINWGAAGTGATTGTISFNAATQKFTVTGSFQYTEETDPGAPNQITVTVSHGTSTPVSTVTATATIADPAVIVTGNFVVNATRGAAVTAQTVATFTDPGGAEVTGTTPNAGEYSATVNWGDSTPTVTLPASDITFSAGAFTVSAGGHTYIQNGNYTITVAVSHPGINGSTVTVSSFASVVDPSVILSSVSNITSLVGTSIKSATVATFTDPAGAQVIAGFPVSGAYTAYINWGDGTAANPDITIGTITYSTTTGAFTVKGSHTYTADSTQPNSGDADNTYHILVTVAHGNSVPATSNTVDATITDPPVLANGNKSVTGVEGSAPATPWLLATFTDPGAPGGTGSGYVATINWGDTTSSAGTIAFDTASGKWQVTGSHAYSSYSKPTYAIQVTITHDSTPVTVHDTATIADAPLTAGTLTVPAAPMNVEAPAGSTAAPPQVLFTFTDANTGESGSDFTATVSWGDSKTNTSADGTGTVTIVALKGGAFEVMGTHVYTEELGHATFAVSVKDAGGAKASASGSLVVTDPAVVLNTTPLTFLSVVNVLSDIQPVATFTDPGGPEVIGGVPKSGEYSALINWGDGTAQSNGVITYNATTHVFTVSGAHRYSSAAGNPYQITVTVAHGSAAPATGVTAVTTVSGSKLNQTITFPTPTASYAPSTSTFSIQVPLSATASSGLPVTYSVKSITLVKNTGTGSITASISGHTLTITIHANTSANFDLVLEADQAGDLNFNAAAPKQVTLLLTNSRRGSGG